MAEKYPLIIFSNLKDTVDITSKALAGTSFGLAGITDSFINARTLLSQYAPEFLLIHLNENCQDTNILVQRLKTVSPRTRILVIPNSWDCNTVFDTIRAGADVIIPDRDELSKLPKFCKPYWMMKSTCRVSWPVAYWSATARKINPPLNFPSC